MESVNSLRISAPQWWPLRERRDRKCEGRNEKCEFLARESLSSSPIVRIFGKGKCKFIANFSATMVTSLPSLSLYLSVSLSLSLSHRKYLTHNIGSASALPIMHTPVGTHLIRAAALICHVGRAFILLVSTFSKKFPSVHLVIDVATSLGPTYREECEVFSSTSPLSSANLYLRITFDKAKVLHDCSFCMQPKGKGKTKTTLCVTNRALSQTHGCSKRCILCFSRVFFFLELGKINERV